MLKDITVVFHESGDEKVEVTIKDDNNDEERITLTFDGRVSIGAVGMSYEKFRKITNIIHEEYNNSNQNLAFPSVGNTRY